MIKFRVVKVEKEPVRRRMPFKEAAWDSSVPCLSIIDDPTESQKAHQSNCQHLIIVHTAVGPSWCGHCGKRAS